MARNCESRVKVSLPGVTLPDGADAISISYDTVGPRYFRTMGTRILRGADFDSMGVAQRTKSVLVNQTMARQFWPGQDSIGRTLRIEGADRQIAGIVEDGKYSTIYEKPMPFLYLPAQTRQGGEGFFLVRTSGDPKALADPVRREMLAASSQFVDH